jgi:hypothetical protein
VADDFDVAAVLAKREERRRRNRERIAELGIDLSPEGIAAEGHQIERERRARRAERAGQLDFGGV